ncbi:MAG: hypothetical protein ACPG05_03210 [Bdellovibrionales bacterium]
MDHKDHNVDHFLKAWKDSKDIETFLDKRIDLPNPNMIRDHLEALPEEERKSAFKELSEIMAKLDVHAKAIKENLKEIEEQMAQTKSAENMCISYEKAKRTTGKKTDE